MNHLDDAVLATVDYGVAPGLTLAVLLGWLPHIAAALAVVWYLIRLWETETVKEWTGRK